MNHLCIIPARAGSKSIKNKNLQKIGNTSLVELAIEQAKKTKIFEKIVLTTDIESLFPIGEIDLIKRDSALCQDDSKMRDVVFDVISKMKKKYDYVWVLQPTSPFRERFHFEEIKILLEKDKPQSVISVKNIGANHPNRCYTIVQNELKPIRFTNFENKQDLMPVYIRNGCFYVFQMDAFVKNLSFHIKKCLPYIMEEHYSQNIDTPMDLAMARIYHESLKK